MTLPDVQAPRALWVEDEPDLVRGSALKIELDTGVRVVFAQDVESAAILLKEEIFSLLIVDLRLPFNGQLRHDGGQVLLDQLKGGALGSANQRIEFVVMTSTGVEVDDSSIRSYQGCEAVYVKAAGSRDLVEMIRKHFPNARVHPEDAWRTLVKVVSADGRTASVIVPSWNPEMRIAVSLNDLPLAARAAIDRREYPVRLLAYVHLGAQNAQDVAPYAFESIGSVPTDADMELEL
ncbi:MAG TPA: hypothetical protein VFQ85_04790 [Mycobacteriales bacterium]|nr:hypothetical protein [Mycobacteriales bacterium]